jgi:vitamin B12 transporter
MERFFLLFLFVFLAVFQPVIASAQDSPHSLPEVVVSAMRVPEPREEITQDITVITKDEIENKGVEFVTDILRTYSDITVAQNGGFGKNATIFLRGGSPNQVVILIDGVKVNSPATGSLDLSGIITQDIERIEIVKGPQSTLYGSEAMAGVINIITKKGMGKPSVAVSFESGSYTTFQSTASVQGAQGMWDYRLTASFFTTDGISAAKGGSERDGSTNKSFSAKIGLTPSEKIMLELNMRYYSDWSALDSFDFTGRLIDSFHYTQKGEHGLISARATFLITDHYQQILTLSTVSDNFTFNDPDNIFNNARIHSSMQTVDWQHNVFLGKATAIAGAEYRREKVHNSDTFDDSVTNKALYLSGSVKLFKDNLLLNAGLRYDNHQTAGGNVTYRAGVLYSIKPYSLRLKANYATGFRAPSLNELFFPFFGNPALKPEKSRGFDAGIEKDLFGGRFCLFGTYFQQKYQDLIQYDFATFSAQNIGNAEAKGTDVGFTARLMERLRLKASYANMETIDKDAGKPLTRRPRNKVVSQLDYSGSRFGAIFEYIYVSQRFDSAVNRDLSPYSLVNFKCRYAVSKILTIFARVDNLFNKNYEEIGGYNTPGASFFAGMRVNF